MSSAPTPKTKLPFGGRNLRGMRLCDCSTKTLEWAVAHWINTDFHAWGLAAKQALEEREASGSIAEEDLEAAADDFLRDHGINPKHVED